MFFARELRVAGVQLKVGTGLANKLLFFISMTPHLIFATITFLIKNLSKWKNTAFTNEYECIIGNSPNLPTIHSSGPNLMENSWSDT